MVNDMDGLKRLIMDAELILKEDYDYFEKVIFVNIEDINKLNDVMLRIKKRLKDNLPEWAWRQ